MGFFKNIGKAVKGAVKNVGKVVSIKNVVGVATGTKSITSLGQEVVNRAITGATGTSGQSGQLASGSGKILFGNKRGVTASQTANLPAATQTMLKAKAGGGVTLGEVLKGAGAGMLQGAGIALSGDKNVADAGADVIDNSLESWFKRHMTKVILVVAGLFGYIMWKKGKTPARGRKR